MLERDKLHLGENLEVCRAHLPDASIDACYIDPPFNTGRDFSEYYDKFTEERPLSVEDKARFEQKWSWLEGITSTSQYNYYKFMIPRLEEIHRVLKPTGSFFLHVDHRECAHSRIVLDKIFGASQTANHLLWAYPAATMAWGKSRSFRNAADHILFYRKSDAGFFQEVYLPLTKKELIKKFPYTNSQGKRYRNTGIQNQREYAENATCNPATSVWQLPIAPQRERTGYPTQKPIALLQRIIECSTEAGQVVLDIFCGSGTTCVAAQQLNRHYIGIDMNPEAIEVAQQRLKRRTIEWTQSS